jgi:hypothetical protein
MVHRLCVCSTDAQLPSRAQGASSMNSTRGSTSARPNTSPTTAGTSSLRGLTMSRGTHSVGPWARRSTRGCRSFRLRSGVRCASP